MYAATAMLLLLARLWRRRSAIGDAIGLFGLLVPTPRPLDDGVAAIEQRRRARAFIVMCWRCLFALGSAWSECGESEEATKQPRIGE